MHGIGTKTAAKLEAAGIRTIYDLAHAPKLQLKQLLGVNGIRLQERALGIDSRPVDPDSIYDYKSIGNSTTLPRDIANERELEDVLGRLSEKVAGRLRNKGLVGQKIGITIRYKDRRTISRSRTADNPFSEGADISGLAKELFRRHWNGNAVRLLGVTAFDVLEKEEAFKQLDIFSFEEEAEKEPLYKALEQLQGKYGKHIIKKGMPGSSGRADTSFSKDFLDKERNTRHERRNQK